MRQKSNILAAVDIGTTKIVTIIGRINENNKLEIIGLGKSPSKGVKRGVVLNIEETVSAIRCTVDEAQKQAGVTLGDVFVGIAGQHIKSVKNRGYINRDSYDDEITKPDIDALIADMHKIPIDVGEEIIHVLPQSFIVDNETGVKNPIGMSGKRLEANFHIVIGQISSAKNIEKCVNRCGLKVNQLILEPIASADAVLTEDEKEAGVALVDIGGGTTDIAVYYDNVIRHTAVIPFGGNVVTSDIKEGCSLLTRQAEALKIQFGSALGDLAPEDKVVTIPGISGRDPKEISFKSLAYIIQSRMEEIIDAVLFEIENSDCMDKLSAGIVITGGGSMLKHLPQLVKFRSGMDVRIGYPSECLTSNTDDSINHPMYSTSIGLLVKGDEILNNKPAEKAETKPGNRPPDNDNDEDDDHKKVIHTPRTRSKGGIFDIIRNISDIFEENDAKM